MDKAALEERLAELLVVAGVGGHMLEAPLLGSGKMGHDPGRAFPAGGQVLFRPQVLAHIGHGKKRGDCVYV